MIPLFKVHMPQGAFEPLVATLTSGYLAEGPRVADFEREFGAVVGNRRAVALNSGTSALTLALRLAGVTEGSSVVTTPMTCTATNLAILSLGADPLWADVDAAGGQISPEAVNARFEYWSRHRITHRKPRAIMLVDWGGAPCDMLSLTNIANRWRVPLIEDAAHALGAQHHGFPVGSISDFTCFSLQAIKHITTGDGGVLTCLDEEKYQRARRLRWFGIDRSTPTGDSRIDVDIKEWGYKFHMNDVAATLGLVQLPYLGRILDRHAANAAWYDRALSSYFERVHQVPGTRSAWWLYTILLPNRSSRDEFVVFMNRRGVQVSRVHRPNDEYSVFEPYSHGALPGTRLFSSRMVCIPVHWALTEDERQQVADACNAWADGAR